LEEEILFWVWVMKWWLTYCFCNAVASADTSVSDSARDPKQEGSAVRGKEEQPVFKGNKGARKYCHSSSHHLPL